VGLNILPVQSGDESEPAPDAAPDANPDATGDTTPSGASEPAAPTDSPASTQPPQQLSTIERNREIDQKLPGWIRALPSVNAGLNTLCTLLLIAGYVAIQSDHRDLHRNLMITAFAVSVVFLGSYLTYHEALYRWTGQRGRAFVGSDLARILYFAILIPHVILAAFVPFLALRIFYHAWKQRWTSHRRLARITLPIWLFVSITGVIIYGMLYHWPWSTIEPTPIDPGSAL
jgi:uncharacterized membrane protein YozB (DUF420 family)